MSDSVTMPALGESVTEGTVTRWLKQVGDTVEVDEPLLEVSTDKVDTEIPSPVAGTVQQILVQEDETVEVGTPLAIIGSGAGASEDGAQPTHEPAAQEPAAQEAEPAQEDEPAPQPAQTTAPEQAPAEQPAAAQPDQGAQAPSGGGDGQQVTMPALGESVTEGTVTRWLKQVGDTVEVDEPLLEVSTDKVDTEIPSPVAGTVQQILVQEDETVDVGASLAVIGSGAAPAAQAPAQDAGTSAPPSAESAPVTRAAAPEPAQELEPETAQASEQPVEPAPTQPAAEQAAAPAAPQPAAQVESTPAGAAAGGRYLTPLVRKLAKEYGVDLSTVTGTGVGGRIRKEDVLEAAERAKQAEAASAPAAPSASAAPRIPEVSPLRGTTEKMTRLRRIIAERMVESLQTQAQLTTVVEVDVTKVARLRAQAKDAFLEREGAKLTYLPFFALAALEALKAYPKINASIDGDQVVYHGQENLGIAVDTERGLVLPVIRDAGELNLAGLARKIADIAERTRANKVTPDELAGATFTITNTGSGGALFDTPIVPNPQVAIMGTGTIVKRPMVVAGPDGSDTIAIRHMCYLSLSYDHRLVDGADAARFLTAVKQRIEDGAFESEVGL